MPIAFRRFPQEKIIALFREAGTGGDEWNIDADRNRPAKDPAQWLANILFHSGLDYMEVEAAGSATINHSSVSTTGGNAERMTRSTNFSWRRGVATHTLANHGLGYEPFALVAWGNNLLWPGMPVQTAGIGGRFVSPFVTTNLLRVREWSSISGNLSSVSRTYTYFIIRRPRSFADNLLWGVDPDTGVVTMAGGKFQSDRRYLQIVSGGTPFGLALGRTIDLNNGAARAYRASGTYFEPVPSDLRVRYIFGVGLGVSGAPVVWGDTKNYKGDYGGPDFIEVQAP